MAKKQEKEYPTPDWLVIIAVLITIVGFYFIAYSAIILGLIGLFCGISCYKWGRQIGNDGILAYFTGFFFSLFGLADYFVYFKIKTMGKEDKMAKIFATMTLVLLIIITATISFIF